LRGGAANGGGGAMTAGGGIGGQQCCGRMGEREGRGVKKGVSGREHNSSQLILTIDICLKYISVIKIFLSYI